MVETLKQLQTYSVDCDLLQSLGFEPALKYYCFGTTIIEASYAFTLFLPCTNFHLSPHYSGIGETLRFMLCVTPLPVSQEVPVGRTLGALYYSNDSPFSLAIFGAVGFHCGHKIAPLTLGKTFAVRPLTSGDVDFLRAFVIGVEG